MPKTTNRKSERKSVWVELSAKEWKELDKRAEQGGRSRNNLSTRVIKEYLLKPEAQSAA